MDTQVAVICDYAADYQGKLCVQGAFDSLYARQFPVVHPTCALAFRLCFTPEDIGDHKLGFAIVDEDGNVLDPKMPIIGDLKIDMPQGIPFLTRNLIMNLQGLKFEKAGNYSVDLTYDGELVSRTPLSIVLVEQNQGAQA